MTDFRPLCDELLAALQRPQRPNPDLIRRARLALEQPQQATETMAEYKEFDDWFHEQEGYGLRSERFWSAFETFEYDSILSWLKQAWSLGHTAGFSKANDIPPLPDNQHLDISWSVATSSALEDQGRAHHIFARLLYSYLTRETPRVSIGEKKEEE